MAQYLMFVYVLIILLSLFLVKKAEISIPFFIPFSIFLILSYTQYLVTF